MIPVSLSISGFLSYREQVDLDFTGFDVACISGSNGSGKSSLLDAITWVLFGQARRRDDAIINSLATTASVTFEFDYETHRYRVQRTKPRDKTCLLEFSVKDGPDRWVPLTEHSLRETEAAIQQTLRLDYETFTNASFFLQGKADQFSQQKPADRKRILGAILGLEVWETYRQNAADQRKINETNLKVLDDRLAEIAKELGEEDARKARLNELEEKLKQLHQARETLQKNLENLRRLAATLNEQRKLVEMLESQGSATQQRRDLLAIQLQDRRAEQSEYQHQIANADQIEAEHAAWQAAVTNLERWEETAASFRQQEALRRAPLLTIEAERARLEEEVRALLQQQRQAEERRAQLVPLQGQMDSLKDKQTLLQERLLTRSALEADILRIQQAQSDLQSENRRLKSEMDEIKERQNALKAVSGAVCSLCGKPLSARERDALIVALDVDGTARGDRFRQNQQEMKTNEANLAAAQTQKNGLLQVDAELRQLAASSASLTERHDQIIKAIEQWEKDGLPRLAEIQNKLAAGDYARPAFAELARVDASLKSLGYDAAAHDAARLAEQQGRASQVALRQLETARAALAPLEREINGLQQQFTALDAELETQTQKAQQARSQYEQDAANLPDLHQAEDEVYHLQEQENSAHMQVGGARQAVEVLQTLRTRKSDYQAQRGELARQIGRLKMLEKAFGKDGIPAQLIESALPEIEEQANLMLDRLSDGGMSVNFVTQRDYKTKNREDKKETLDILINDAAGSREYEMFSGGEAFRVNFAIRLALSRVLAQRAGARLQVLVIDEGFGSQDADGIQRLTEAINLVRADFAKILVITHLESMKDVFPARIEVEKTPLGSTVRVINQ